MFLLSTSLSTINCSSVSNFPTSFKTLFSKSEKDKLVSILSKRFSLKYSISLSSALLKIKKSRCFLPLLNLLNFLINFLNNFIVALASFNALCAHSKVIQKELHNISKFKEDSLKDKKLARKKVSILIFFLISIQLFIKKSISNCILCHKIGSSHIKSKISFFSSSMVGAQFTSSLVIFVIFDIISGISICGSTRDVKVPTSLKVFSSNFTIAISIILSPYLSKPVVSKSKQIIIFLK